MRKYLISIFILLLVVFPCAKGDPLQSVENTSDINRLIVHADLGVQRINKYIYGHFSEHLGRCVYE